MDRIKQGMRAACLLVAAAAAVAPATASAAINNQTLTLDTRAANVAGTVQTTSSSTTNNQWYVTSVTGTFSFNAASYWTTIPSTSVFRVCGPIENAPLNNSTGVPAGTNGKVNADPEFMFARRWQWDCSTSKLPLKIPNFESNYTGSTTTGWTHEVPAGGVPNAPTASHRYVYFKKGNGHSVSWRMNDAVTSDNYGRLTINIRKATSTDCANNQWQLFLKSDGSPEFTSQTNCQNNI
jgi:hypothetical protein